MNLHKLLIHDIKCGLIRARYWVIPVVIAVPCIEYINWTSEAWVHGSWMDLMFFIFKGQEPIEISSTMIQLFEFPMPMVWLLVMGACLFLNLDYFLYDLSLTGQQIIIRCGNRRMWFLSKCIWNILSTFVYFLLAAATALLFILLLNGKVSLETTPEIQQIILGNFDLANISSECAIILGIVVPYLTLAALNIIQMTLCIFVKPIISFLCIAGLLVLSVYVSNGFILGNGAMTIRTAFCSNSGVYPKTATILAITTIFFCILIGMLTFKKMDIFPRED